MRSNNRPAFVFVEDTRQDWAGDLPTLYEEELNERLAPFEVPKFLVDVYSQDNPARIEYF